MSGDIAPHGDARDLAEGGGFGVLGQRIGLVLGPAIAIGLQLLPAPTGLSPEGWMTVSLLALMVIWWVTEPIPVAATALIPLVGLPLFGVVRPGEAAAPYADPIIFLFIGGFILAVAVERWNLHARAALSVAVGVGVNPRALVGGFILGAGLISMWISNTATALMLMPIAVAVAQAVGKDGRADPKLGMALVLGVAYAASIGGMGTPVGSPTNLIAMGYLEKQGLSLSFSQWMMLGVPVMALLLPALWLIVSAGMKPAAAIDAANSRATVRAALRSLGPLSAPETRIMIVFGLVALGWMTRELLVKIPGLGGLTDMMIAIAGALVLFMIPSGAKDDPAKPLLDWPTAERLPWGIALLFGGGLSIAGAMEATGLSDWLALMLGGVTALHPILVVAVLIAITVVVTELMSNVATLTALLPIIGSLAVAAGVNPLFLAFPACLAASLGFMLPIATAPNAVAYATGLAPAREMLRRGLALNVAGMIAILIVTELIGPMVLR